MARVDKTRARIPGMSKPRLSPVGGPQPAYVMAPALEGGGSALLELAGSLGKVDRSLSGLSTNIAARKAENQRKQAELLEASRVAQEKSSAAKDATDKASGEAQARRHLAGMTTKDVRDKIASGELKEYENPYYRAALDKSLGGREAREDGLALEQAVAAGEFNPLQDSAEDWLAERAAARLEGASDHYVSGYLDEASKIRDVAIDDQSEAKTEAMTKARKEAAHEVFLGVLSEDSGRPLQERLAEARGIVKDTLGIPFGSQDDMVLGIAQTLAEEGEVDLVKELLWGERVSADGTKVSPIGAKLGYGDKAMKAVARAEAQSISKQTKMSTEISTEYDLRIYRGEVSVSEVLEDERLSASDKRGLIGKVIAKDKADRKKAEAQAKDAMRAKGVAALEANAYSYAAQGKAYLIMDQDIPLADGSRVTLSAEKGRKFAVNKLASDALTAAAQKKGSPLSLEENVFVVSSVVSDNRQTYEPWENALSNVAYSANMQSLAGGGDIPQGVFDSYSLYRAMDPKVAEDHVKDEDSREFYRMATVAERSLGLSPEDAVRFAARGIVNDKPPMSGKKIKNLDKAIDRMDFSRMPFFDGGANTDLFLSSARSEIRDSATVLVQASGMSPEVAVETATEEWERNHVAVGGSPVRVPKGYTRSTFKPVAKGYLDYWKDTNGMADEKNLYLASVQNGAYYVVMRDGFPVSSVEDDGTSSSYRSVVTPGQMERVFYASNPKDTSGYDEALAIAKSRKLKEDDPEEYERQRVDKANKAVEEFEAIGFGISSGY